MGQREVCKAYKGRAVELQKGQFIKVINTPGTQVSSLRSAAFENQGGLGWIEGLSLTAGLSMAAVLQVMLGSSLVVAAPLARS